MPQKKSSWRKAFEKKARAALLRQRIANLQRQISETMQSTNPGQVFSGIEDQARRIGAGYSTQPGPPPPPPPPVGMRQKLGAEVPWWARTQPGFMAPRSAGRHVGPEVTEPAQSRTTFGRPVMPRLW